MVNSPFPAPQLEISVVMAVYGRDAGAFNRSVGSILNQVGANLELVIVDDCGPLSASSLLEKGPWKNDSRIKIIVNDFNLGLTRSLCRGVAIAASELIARQDADDFSCPDRLRSQIEFMRQHPNVGLLGTYTEYVGEDGRIIYSKVPTDSDELKKALFRINPFCHSSVVFRKAVYFKVGGYDPRFYVSQDLDLWLRMSRVTELGMIDQFLVQRFLTKDSISRSCSKWNQAFLSLITRINHALKQRSSYFLCVAIYAGLKHFLLNFGFIERIVVYFKAL